MTTLLLKTKRNYFNGRKSTFILLGRDRERHGLWSDSGGEFWSAAGIYIHSLVQLKVPRTNCEQIALPSSSRACEHVHLIYEISYCYKDRR